jgi:hypothetical protein
MLGSDLQNLELIKSDQALPVLPPLKTGNAEQVGRRNVLAPENGFYAAGFFRLNSNTGDT